MKIIESIKTHPRYTGIISGAIVGGSTVVAAGVASPTLLGGAVALTGFTTFWGFVFGDAFGAGMDMDKAIAEARRRANGEAPEIAREVAKVEIAASLPNELKAQVQRLKKIGKLHAGIDSPMLEHVNSILADSQELFKRIMAKQDSQAHRLAAVNYTDTLSKLNRALDDDYYLDIKKNPRLWSNPAERLEAVEKAVKATEKQLLLNIQQVNASQDIDYEVSLESLTNSMDSISATDLSK
jgi:hypothetical protein